MEKEEKQRYELKPEEAELVVGGTAPKAAPVSSAEVVERAMQEIGKPYQWGACGPNAYDASGLVSYCLTGYHTHLWTTGNFMSWPRVDVPTPGDVCTNEYDCGIYIGPGRMICAGIPGTVVSERPIAGNMIIVRYEG